MKRTTWSIIFLCVTLMSTSANVAQTSPQSRPSKQRRCSLPDVLWEIADKHDVYFTIENDNTGLFFQTPSTAWHLGVLSQPWDEHCPYLQEGASDVSTELQAIQRDLPVLGYAVDGLNPKIIHVFDNRSAKLADYPMNKVIGPLEFKGTEAELVYYLNRHGIDIGFGSNFDVGRAPKFEPRAAHAHETPVDINLGQATLREVLSQFIPANKAERILWSSVITITMKPPYSVFIHVGYRWDKEEGHVYVKN